MNILNLKDLLIGEILGKGGEGIVYDIQNSNNVYKEFKEVSVGKVDKIKALIRKNLGNKYIAIPSALVENDNKIVGFIMPKVEGIEFSKSICLPKTRFEQKLEGYKREDLLEIALDLVKKVEELHSKNILIGDINPNNFMLNKDEKKVYLIDCDSYQVDNFPCPVGTQEFTAPELQGVDFRYQLRDLNNELFSLAVMLFTILMPGQKPYAAKDNGDIIENIRNLNFPYPLGVEHDYKEPIGKWDLIWRQFDSKLKEVFYSTFKNNNRVQVCEWKEILSNSINELLDNEIFPNEDKRIQIDASYNWLGRNGLGDMRTTILKNYRETEHKIAVLELSTRAVKLLIRNDLEDKEFSFDDFHDTNGGFREGVLTKTGKGLRADGNMDMDYFMKAVSPSIEKFVNKALNQYKVKHIYCFATAAIRSSRNKKEILDYLKSKFGINCRILSKEEEATYTAKAFRYTSINHYNGKNLVDNHQNKKIIFIDQGGGSTEFILFNNLDNPPLYPPKSLNLGTTTLENALYINSNYDTPLEKAFSEIDNEIDKKLQTLFKDVKKFKADGCVAVGTAITKASGKKGNRNQHCVSLNKEYLSEKLISIRKKIIAEYMTVGNIKTALEEDRRSKNRLDSDFTMALGLKAYIDIMDFYGLDHLIVSGTGLWYGIFYKGYEDIVLHRDHMVG